MIALDKNGKRHFKEEMGNRFLKAYKKIRLNLNFNSEAVVWAYGGKKIYVPGSRGR